MRSLLSLWLPALVAVAQAASSTGQIYFYEQHSRTSSQQQSTVEPKTAGLILASRLGVAQFHDLGVCSDDTLSAINAFGNQKKLFDSSASQAPVALLLATSEATFDKSYTRNLHISAMPSMDKTSVFFQALAAQKGGFLSAQSVRSGESATTDDSSIRVIHDAPLVSGVVRDLHNKGYDVILVISPRQSSSSASYGTYTLPSSLRKRQIDIEEPLEDFSLSISDNNTVSAPSNKTSPTTKLAGILPFCYSSKSLCESTTRNCTGHGSCRLAYTQKAQSGDDKGVPCYQCACTPTVRKNKNGSKKTIVWAGPACQKKDITTPFWLLATFSVFMMFLVGWGVGTIWSMGEEELPSVIGAGVSGPTRK
ncbi:hypothetical protein K461DRAFT_295339 [Myriangium duriaei CBS 260.36]|uniref:DUF3844 domain-containing protein n=1 Tax=Myriangium duriaei CBS 260.36 TaxID=1168546 RepID=A0A9P4IYH5_9PEZI|nr:hypothetical protein K461DRAFT_295339 [Myriangium duriaei CBS 260.36]